MLGTEVCATELRRRVSAGNRGVCNRAEEKAGWVHTSVSSRDPFSQLGQLT